MSVVKDKVEGDWQFELILEKELSEFNCERSAFLKVLKLATEISPQKKSSRQEDSPLRQVVDGHLIRAPPKKP